MNTQIEEFFPDAAPELNYPTEAHADFYDHIQQAVLQAVTATLVRLGRAELPSSAARVLQGQQAGHLARPHLPPGASLGDWPMSLGALVGSAALSQRLSPPPPLPSHRSPQLPARAATVPLSPREREVLERIAAGDSNKVIARAFDLSPHTVKRHVANILGKLGAESRGQAAAWLRSQQWARHEGY